MALLDIIIQLLHWAVPGGIGVGVAWLLNRNVRTAHEAKEVHDTYKEMYADVSRSLTEMRGENEKLFNAIIRLEHAVQRANTCRYWDACPIRSELPYTENHGTVDYPGGYHGTSQHRIRDSGDLDGGSGRRQRSGDSTDDVDADTARGSDIQPEERPDPLEPQT